MSKLDVRIVHLDAMRLASAYGFGPSPEGIAHEKIAHEKIAHEKMQTFLKANNLLDGYGTKYRHFGFNNPNPSPGSPNYGYEIWAEIAPDVQPEGDIRIVDFPGGLYVVTRFTDLENIGRVWGELVQWREASMYREAHHQWLENLINPLEADFRKYMFDLYLPIAE